MSIVNTKLIQLNAVIYARYSSYRQDERSIEGQIEDCIRYAENNNLKVVGEYIDRAKSGTEAEHRPEFQRMIKDSEKSSFSVVLVYKLDRFARNRYDSAMYKAKLKKHGVRVVSATEAISEEAEGVILESLLEGLAEYYSKNLAQNVTRGMRVARSHGTFTGGTVPYGYRVEGKKLVPDEIEARVVRRVFELYADHMPMADIIEKLNEEGYKPRKGTTFAINSFYRVLRSRKYLGEYELDGVQYPDIYPKIIDEELFNTVQERLKLNRTYKQRSETVTYQLQGKVFCGMCGAPMIGECGRGKAGNTYHYYTCANRKKRHTCKKKNEKKDFLEWYVVEQTVDYILSPERTEYIAKRLCEQYEKDFNAKKISELEKISRTLSKDIEKCLDSLIDNAGKQEIVNRLQERFENLSAQKSDVDIDIAKLKILCKNSYTVEQYKQWLGTFAKGDATDEKFRQYVIDTFVNSVYVFDDKVVIYYNIKDGKQISYMEMCDDLEDLEPINEFESESQRLTNVTGIRTLLIINSTQFGLVIRRTGE